MEGTLQKVHYRTYITEGTLQKVQYITEGILQNIIYLGQKNLINSHTLAPGINYLLALSGQYAATVLHTWRTYNDTCRL